ncbi:MAG: hypothetical protein ACRDWX_08955 [Acidimicrobiia bacterium]
MLGRLALLAASAYLFGAGFRIFPATATSTLALGATFVVYLSALGCLGAGFVTWRRSGHLVEHVVAAAVALALVSSVAYEIEVANPRYGTDAIAFAHAGTEIFLQGRNPYEVRGPTVEAVLDQFGVPRSFITRTTDGGTIDRLISYPALHVVLFAPFMASGIDDLRWVVLFFELASLAVIWQAVSPRARLVVPLVLLLEPNLAILFTSGGVTDWLWVLPLVLAALALHRGSYAHAGLALGLACAVKQQPWFAVPFVTVWVAHQTARSSERWVPTVAGFLGMLAAAFTIPNLPFILWSPGDWLGGVLQPALAEIVPDGQGISLLSSRGLIAAPRGFYTVLTVGMLGLLILLYTRYHSRLQDLLWVLPAVVLFASYRSLHNYYIFWLPVAAMWLDLRAGKPGRAGAAPAGKDRSGRTNSRRSAHLLGGGGILFVLLLVAGMVGAAAGGGVPHASVDVLGVETEVSSGMVQAIDVRARNASETDAELVFDVLWGHYPFQWVPEGDGSLAAGSTRSFRLLPSGPEAIPPSRMGLDGMVQASPFRVRVNAAGESRFFSSEIVRPEPQPSSVINPRLKFWADLPAGSGAPFGWSVSRRSAPGAVLVLEPLDVEGGLASLVEHDGRTDDGWVEVALVQPVASLAPCYELRLLHSVDYAALADSSPARVVGLQVIQGGASLWFVPAPGDEIRATDLADSTRIVEIPSAAGRWEHLQLQLARYAPPVLALHRGGVLKIFSALQESERGPAQLLVRSLEAVDC